MQQYLEVESMKGTFTVQDTSVIEKLKFDQHGLIPAIVQDVKSSQVLMLAYMNKESLVKTLTEGKACYYSRSRQQLWLKGETSGNYQYVQEIYYDCDADSLLVLVEQDGVACHEEFFTCFHNQLQADGTVQTKGEPNVIPRADLGKVLDELHALITTRKQEMPEGSYTTYLFAKGQDKILKKVGEETAESIIASKNNNPDEIAYEVSDLFYHLLVMLVYHGMSPVDIAEELVRRHKK